MSGLFVTGMIRSGTTLVQTLLTSHPDVFVAYQPFHQLHVEVKRRFLAEEGVERVLPLGDGMSEPPQERVRFRRWLATTVFPLEDVAVLIRSGVQGKGGSIPELAERLEPVPGTFADLRGTLVDQVAGYFGAGDRRVRGTKEVLCEEYLPAMADSGVASLLVVRDPRAVVASAGSGRYLDQVGDRYPLLMLVRLWRKSALHAVDAGRRANAMWLRYEDVVEQPQAQLDRIAARLGIAPLGAQVLERPLRDHAGRLWQGNSSFGTKRGVDAAGATAWRERLDPATARFVEACTWPEMHALGFDTDIAPAEAEQVVREYREDERGVRPSYLDFYRLTEERREQELSRTTGHWCL